MLNKITSYILVCSVLFIPTYAMDPAESGPASKVYNRDVRDKAALDLPPYEKFPPLELDQALLEHLFCSSSNSIMLEENESPLYVPSNHVLYNNIWFGPKALDDKCARLEDILKNNKKANNPAEITAVLAGAPVEPRNINTFTTTKGMPLESVLAQYDIYIGEDLYQESSQEPNPGRFMFSVTKREPTAKKKKITTPQLNKAEKYKKTLDALFIDKNEVKLDPLETILYSYPFFMSGKDLLAHLSEINKKYPDKVEKFLQLLADEVSLGGKESMRLNEEDMKALSTWPNIHIDLPPCVQTEHSGKEFDIPNLINKKELNNDNYIEVINLNEGDFSKALWARDHCLIQNFLLTHLMNLKTNDLSQYSTQTSNWVAFQILTSQDKQKMFEKFLSIGEHLLHTNNIHGAMQIICGLSNGTVLRAMEKPSHKDKHRNDLLHDPRWTKLQNIIRYPNADKHYNSSNPDRFLSFSAMSGRIISWCEEFDLYDLPEKDNKVILNGIAAVAKSFVSLQRQTFAFTQDIKPQYSKLVCGIGFCDIGEIRKETLEAISSLLIEYPLVGADPSIQRTFKDLKDDYFCNFLRNRGCERKSILKIFKRGIFSGDKLIQYTKSKETFFGKVEKLEKLGIPTETASFILNAYYAETPLDSKDYYTTLKLPTKKKGERKGR